MGQGFIVTVIEGGGRVEATPKRKVAAKELPPKGRGFFEAVRSGKATAFLALEKPSLPSSGDTKTNLGGGIPQLVDRIVLRKGRTQGKLTVKVQGSLVGSLAHQLKSGTWIRGEGLSFAAEK